MKLSVNKTNIIFISFLWVFFYLLGNYLGGYFNQFNHFLNILLLLDALHFIICINTLNYYQNFSTEHPKKGELINYTLTIQSKIKMPTCYFEIFFNKNMPDNRSLSNIKHCTNKYHYEFKLPYRGVYDVGIEKIVTTDLLLLFNYNIDFWPRTFYVYPNLTSIIEYKAEGTGMFFENEQTGNSTSGYSLKEIKEYTAGTPLSHISWKHFASLGTPYIKYFEAEEESFINLFLDKTTLQYDRVGPADDMAIEIFCSLLQKNIKSHINCWKEKFISDGNFNLFLRDSIYINFNLSKEESLNNFNNQNYINTNKLIIITTFENDFFFDKVFLNNYRYLTVYVITLNLSKVRKNILRETIKKLSNSVEIICI